jgi:hypothetical protein
MCGDPAPVDPALAAALLQLGVARALHDLERLGVGRPRGGSSRVVVRCGRVVPDKLTNCEEPEAIIACFEQANGWQLPRFAPAPPARAGAHSASIANPGFAMSGAAPPGRRRCAVGRPPSRCGAGGPAASQATGGRQTGGSSFGNLRSRASARTARAAPSRTSCRTCDVVLEVTVYFLTRNIARTTIRVTVTVLRTRHRTHDVMSS